MLKWINDYCKKVEKYPERFNKNIKNQCKLIKELLTRKNIVYKEADPIAFEKFCHLFIHQKGEWAGKEFIPDDLQRFIIACIMGIKYYDNDKKRWLRYFRQAHIFVARKWGKSFLASAFVLWFLGFDRENGAEVRILAENKEQSSRLFKTVDESRKTNPLLAKYFKKRYNKDTCAHEIYCKDINDMDCIFTYVSGRTKGADGDNNSLIIADEVHEITSHELYDSKITGQGARQQPLALVISTAGILQDSLFERLCDTDYKILDKKKYGKDDKIFAVIFGIDSEDSIDDERCWVKANPSLPEGRPTIEYLRSQYNNAKSDSVALSSFIAKHLNRQIGSSNTYYSLIEIKECMSQVKKEDFYDTYATGGVDLSATTDLCNATAEILKGEKKIVLQAYFVAENCIDNNSKKDRKDYKQFIEMQTENEITSRLVIVTPGNTVDYHYVTQWFATLRDEYKINFLKIGYDKAMSNYWVADMAENGFTHEKVEFDKDKHVESRDDGILTPIYQGKALDPAIRVAKGFFEMKKYIIDENNKLLPYCFYNAMIKPDGDNKLSVHKAKSTGHIDGCIGVFNSEIAYNRAKEIYSEILENIFV